MSLSDALPPQEKHRIAANHYRITNETAKAIEAYENLAKASPNNVMVHFDLGGLYEQRGDLDEAREQYFASVVELDPKFVEGLLALGRVEIRRSNFAGVARALEQRADAVDQFNHDEARANILQAIGIAYMRLKARRGAEALPGVAGDQDALGNKRGMAGSLGEIAQVQRGAWANPKKQRRATTRR